MKNITFFYNEKTLECVDEFTYLGIVFTKKGLTNKTVTARETASKKAMFSFLTRCKKNLLPIDIQLDVFNKTVIPCMLYGGELWGYNNTDCLELVQRKFLKYALKLKTGTCTAFLYCESGYLPIEVEIKIRMVSFWVNLLIGRRDKFSYKMYLICLSLYRRGLVIFKWLDNVVSILNETGFSYVFIDQLNIDGKYLKNVLLPKIKIVVRDQAKQALFEKISQESDFPIYPNIVTFHKTQNYLVKMPPDIWIPLIKIRTGNHKLPIQFHSWKIVYKPKEARICTICRLGAVGDEMHYIMHCPVFDEDRKKYLPSTEKDKTLENFIKLLKSEKISTLRGLAKFLNILFGVFE